MKVTTETVATREVLLTIEPDPQDVQKALRKAARQISRTRPLRGYRPGKAPYALVERVFGRETLLNEALGDMAPGLYREAIKEASIEPYEYGRWDVESRDPVVLKVNVPLVPVVTLGDYRSLQIDPEPQVSVTEEQIDERIEQLRRRQARHETVERPVQLGDEILASVTGVSGNETVIDDEDAILDVEDSLSPPGFAEALVGMSANEPREFTLAYPEDFHDEALAGKDVSFSITIKAIRQLELPEIDDDLAKEAGDYETLAELREGIAVELEERLKDEAQQREANAAIDALAAQATVDYPAAAVEREVDTALSRRKARVQRLGFDFDKYLEMIKSSEQQLREELRPEAERTLVRRLVLTEFARTEELRVDEAELDARIAIMASAYGDRAPEVSEELRDRRAALSIRGELFTEKVVSHLTAMLTGRATEDEETPEEDEPEAPESVEGQAAETEEAQRESATVDHDIEAETTEA